MTMLEKIKRCGMTYLEILLAIGVWVLVATAISVIFGSSLNVFRSAVDKNEALQRAQIASEWIVRDIQGARGVMKAETYNISLVVEPSLNYVSYAWNSSSPDKKITRRVCSDPEYLLTQGVTSFALKYFDVNNQVVTDPVNNIIPIKTIEIDLTSAKNNKTFHLNSVARFDLNPEYPWAKAFDDQTPRSIVSTTDNKFLLAGLTFSASGYGSGDIALTKVDVEGKREWAKVCGTANNEQVYGVAALIDGGYAVAGIIPNINSDFFLAKINSAGALVWSYIYEVTTIPNAYVAVSGFCADSSGFVVLVHDMQSNYLHVVKLDTDGNIVPAQCKTFKQGLIAKGVARISDGYIIAGNILSSESSWGKSYNEFFLMKIDAATGNKLWFKTYGNGSTAIDATAFKAVTGATDEYLIAGTYTSGTNKDIILMKIDAAGDNLLLVKSYSTPTNDNVNDIERPAGGYLLAGNNTESAGSYSDASIIEVNDTGVKQWARLIAASGDQYAQDIQLTPKGDSVALVYGSWIAGGGSVDTLLARIGKQGEMECCSLIADNTASVTEGTPSGYSMTESFTTLPTVEALAPTRASGGYAIKDITLPAQNLCPAP